MNPKQLEYFICVAENKSITAASNKLLIAQPALSRQIILIEEELGTVLFERSNRGVELTDTGKVFLWRAKKLLMDIKEMTEVVNETKDGIRGQINIGTFYSTIPLCAEKIRYVSEHYPHIRFDIYAGEADILLEKLEKREVDLLFLRNPIYEYKEFSYKVIEEDELVLGVHRGLDPDPLSKTLKISQLNGVPLCLLSSGRYWRHNEILINKCHKEGFDPRIICTCHDSSLIMMMLTEKVGLTYQPRSVITRLNHPDIYPKPLCDLENKSNTSLVWNDSIYLPQCLRLFLSLFGVTQ